MAAHSGSDETFDLSDCETEALFGDSDEEEYEYTERLAYFKEKKISREYCCSRQCWSKLNITQLKIHLDTMAYVSRLTDNILVRRMLILACYCTSLGLRQRIPKTNRKKRRVVEFRIPAFDVGFCKDSFLELFDISKSTFQRWKIATGGVRCIVPPSHALQGREGIS